MVGRGGKKAKKAVSKQARAGISFPVARLKRYLKSQMPKMRMASGAPVYMAAVLEYLTAEVMELAGNAARDHKRSRIVPRHVMFAVRYDQELQQVWKNVTIPAGGVVPNIRSELVRSVKKGQQGHNITFTSQPAQKAAAAAAPKKKAVKRAGKAGKATPKPAAPKKQGSKTAAGGLTVLTDRTLSLGHTITVVSGDIVDVKADVIVHPTNANCFLGGEVGTRLSNVGGQEFRDNVDNLQRTLGALPQHGAAVCAGKNFKSPMVMHTNGPSWSGMESIGELEKTIENCLKLAHQEKFKTICFPSVGSGKAGFPKQEAAQTILRSISAYFKKTPKTTVKQVFFNLYDQQSINVYVTELARLVE